MRPGQLRERVTIQAATPTTDAGGGTSTAWSAIGTTPTVSARVTPLTGEERASAQQIDARASHEVTIRYRTDVNASQRLSWESRLLYPVTPWLNHDERKRFLTATCREDTD